MGAARACTGPKILRRDCKRQAAQKSLSGQLPEPVHSVEQRSAAPMQVGRRGEEETKIFSDVGRPSFRAGLRSCSTRGGAWSAYVLTHIPPQCACRRRRLHGPVRFVWPDMFFSSCFSCPSVFRASSAVTGVAHFSGSTSKAR